MKTFNIDDLDLKIENNIETYYFGEEKVTGKIYFETNSYYNFDFEAENGVRNGLEKEFSRNGAVIKTQNYKDGIEEGEGKEFYESGELKEELFFKKGELVLSNEYDQEGKLIDTYRTS